MMHLKQLGNQSFAFLLLSGLGSVRDRTRKLIRADGGAAAVFFALTSPIWLGGVALAAEVGSWYYLQQKIQGTADSVALGTARRIPSGASRDELIYESGQQVELELIPGSTLSNLQISSSGANWVDGTTVEATVSLSRPLLLSKLFMDGDNIEIAAHSTAEVSRAAPGCVLSLQKAMQGGVSVNAANIRLTGCDVISNSVQNFRASDT